MVPVVGGLGGGLVIGHWEDRLELGNWSLQELVFVDKVEYACYVL